MKRILYYRDEIALIAAVVVCLSSLVFLDTELTSLTSSVLALDPYITRTGVQPDMDTVRMRMWSAISLKNE